MSKYDYFILEDVIEQMGSIQLELKATFLENNEIITLSNWTYISDYLISRYGDRSILLLVDGASNNLMLKFLNFINLRQHNIDMLYTAFRAYYNPIENYNRYENSEISKSGNELHTIDTNGQDKNTIDYGKKDITNTYGQIKSNTVNGATRLNTESKISADNSDNYQPDNLTTTNTDAVNIDTTTSSRTDTESTAQKVDKTTTEYGKNITDSLKYIDRKNATSSHIHGNIGVTTGAQMIQGELSVRLVDLVNLILDEFAKLYTIYL